MTTLNSLRLFCRRSCCLRGRRLGRSSLRGGSNQRRRLDRIQFGPALVDICLAMLGDLVLVWAGGVPILVVEHLDYFHSLRINDAKGRKALPVQAGIVLHIDEDLSRTRIWHAGFRVGQIAPLVAPDNGFILDIRFFPGGRNRRVGADAELDHKTGDDTKKAGIVIKVVLDQIVEAVRAEGSPCASDTYREVSACGHKFYL